MDKYITKHKINKKIITKYQAYGLEQEARLI